MKFHRIRFTNDDGRQQTNFEGSLLLCYNIHSSIKYRVIRERIQPDRVAAAIQLVYRLVSYNSSVQSHTYFLPWYCPEKFSCPELLPLVSSSITDWHPSDANDKYFRTKPLHSKVLSLIIF